MHVIYGIIIFLLLVVLYHLYYKAEHMAAKATVLDKLADQLYSPPPASAAVLSAMRTTMVR